MGFRHNVPVVPEQVGRKFQNIEPISYKVEKVKGQVPIGNGREL